MIIILEEENNYIKVLNTRSREYECSTNELSEIHKRVGVSLGERILNKWPLKEIEIQNAQNKRGTGYTFDHSNVTLVTMMRAGLYLSLGIKEVLGNGFSHILSNKATEIKAESVIERDIILVDSVINSGASVEQYIEALSTARSITVACLVMQSGFIEKVQNKYPLHEFYTSRVSDNYYVGSGKNDTGNRLFGTF
ncbi:MAG: hypothetical protein DRR08_09715 [Candidatus Parabeggiatoa sp. nov. 2]|nr:MAG: hypothetical protein B6247_17875 [Beggiatoa sp. 4572_84]RKZ61069.1 MAG: hypothetical protein DRR08_09715 [Gammaproteobacteria bacterium]